MVGISTDTRVAFWVIAAISGGLFAIVGSVLAENIVYFFSRGIKLPAPHPVRVWAIFYVSFAFSIIFGALAAFAPPQSDKTSVTLLAVPTELSSESTLTIDPCKKFVSRVYKGEKVYAANVLDENLNIRRSPNLSAKIITYVKNGTEFQILNGPVCADGLMWWEASTNNGSTKGWIAEVNSNGTYYIEPK